MLHLQIERQILDAVTLFGVAFFPENGSTRAAILKAADDALYSAKYDGRNQVVLAS